MTPAGRVNVLPRRCASWRPRRARVRHHVRDRAPHHCDAREACVFRPDHQNSAVHRKLQPARPQHTSSAQIVSSPAFLPADPRNATPKHTPICNFFAQLHLPIRVPTSVSLHAPMSNRVPPNPSNDQPTEQDPLWSLLLQGSPPPQPSSSFLTDVLAAAAETTQATSPHPIHRLGPVSGRVILAAAAAVALLAGIPWIGQSCFNPASPLPSHTTHFDTDSAELEEWAATETLIAATDNIDQLTDAELADLLGF